MTPSHRRLILFDQEPLGRLHATAQNKISQLSVSDAVQGLTYLLRPALLQRGSIISQEGSDIPKTDPRSELLTSKAVDITSPGTVQLASAYDAHTRGASDPSSKSHITDLLFAGQTLV